MKLTHRQTSRYRIRHGVTNDFHGQLRAASDGTMLLTGRIATVRADFCRRATLCRLDRVIQGEAAMCRGATSSSSRTGVGCYHGLHLTADRHVTEAAVAPASWQSWPRHPKAATNMDRRGGRSPQAH